MMLSCHACVVGHVEIEQVMECERAHYAREMHKIWVDEMTSTPRDGRFLARHAPARKTRRKIVPCFCGCGSTNPTVTL